MDWTIVTLAVYYYTRLCLTGVIKHLFYGFLFVNHIIITINIFQSSFGTVFTAPVNLWLIYEPFPLTDDCSIL